MCSSTNAPSSYSRRKRERNGSCTCICDVKQTVENNKDMYMPYGVQRNAQQIKIKRATMHKTVLWTSTTLRRQPATCIIYTDQRLSTLLVRARDSVCLLSCVCHYWGSSPPSGLPSPQTHWLHFLGRCSIPFNSDYSCRLSERAIPFWNETGPNPIPIESEA